MKLIITIILVSMSAHASKPRLIVIDDTVEIKKFSALSYGNASTTKLNEKRFCLHKNECFQCPKDTGLIFNFYGKGDQMSCVQANGKVVDAVSVE